MLQSPHNTMIKLVHGVNPLIPTGNSRVSTGDQSGPTTQINTKKCQAKFKPSKVLMNVLYTITKELKGLQ